MIRLALCCAWGALTLPAVHAGGFLAVDNTGQPYKWDGPIEVRLDPGPLGRLNKAEADALAMSAINTWTSATIAGSGVQFVRGPDLSEDHGDGLGTDPNFDLCTDPNGNCPPSDGITAIIYDQTGALIDGALGAGASSSVVGFAGPMIPDDYSPAPLVEGLAVLNGRFIDDDQESGVPNGPWDLTPDVYRGAFIHEIGHMLNLDHSQAALQYSDSGVESGTYYPLFGIGSGLGRTPDYRGLPTMFPFVLPDIHTLELDDKVWITHLYPGPDAPVAGSLSGTARDFAGDPVNGVNITAFDADDPTKMITCVTGYTDSAPETAPTGTYRIPGLPPGTTWIVDSEPINAMFTGGSSVGPLDPPAPLPGAPEFLNEEGVESVTDPAHLTTAFMIPGAPANPNINNVNLRFADINDFDQVQEVENNAGPEAAQVLNVTPGRYTFVEGFADPNDPGGIDLSMLGKFVDFYVVDHPAGLELNQVVGIGHDADIEVYVMEQDPTNPSGEFVPLTGTGLLTGPTLSLAFDHSRIGQGVGAGKFYFAVVVPSGILGGTSGPTDYTLGVLFSVSDRDAVVVKGTDTGVVNPNSGLIRVLGRGFKNLGGPPTVEFSTPGIQVTGVTYVNSNTLDVSVVRQPEFMPGSSTAITVTNHPLSGGYAGRRSENVIAVPVVLSGFELE